MTNQIVFNPSRMRLNVKHGLLNASNYIEHVLNGKLFPQRFQAEVIEANDGFRAKVTSEEPFDPTMIERALFGTSDSSSPLFN